MRITKSVGPINSGGSRPCRRRAGMLAAIVLGVCAGTPVLANPAGPPPGADEPQPRRVGIGWKIGNGIGALGGDLVIRLMDHLSLDLQANYISSETTGGDRVVEYEVALLSSADFSLRPAWTRETKPNSDLSQSSIRAQRRTG